MRILAIRGGNLASLKGSFEIDLGRPPLCHLGLFAIAGPVGAGKSTLLDAMCLALFNRTPRLNGRGGAHVVKDGDAVRSNDPRSLVRRGAATAFAEVDFVGKDGRAWRARWQVKRARGQAFGRLQDEIVTLVDIASGQREGDGKESTLDAIRDRLGLTFDEVCRSVLLAQGGFASFLKARADERAALLEKITGTEIYSTLSMGAHARAKEEQARLKQLEGELAAMPPACEDERAALEASVTDAEALRAQCVATVDEAEAWQRWLERSQALARAVSDADRALDDAQRARAESTAAVRTTELERAWPLRALHRASIDADNAHARAQVARERALDDARRANSALAAARERKARASEARTARARALDDAEPSLEHALILDGQIGASDAPALAAAHAHAREDAAAVERDARAAQKMERAAEAALATATAALAADPDAARILPTWPALAADLARLAKDDRDLAGARAIAAAAESQRDTSRAALDHAERALDDARARLAGVPHLATRIHIEHAEERAALVEGEPCPLCGSREHPAAHVDVEELREAVLAMNTALECERALADARASVVIDEQAIAIHVRVVEERARARDNLARSVTERLHPPSASTGAAPEIDVEREPAHALDLVDLRALAVDLDARTSILRSAEQRAIDARASLAATTPALRALEQKNAAAAEREQSLALRAAQARAHLDELKRARAELFSGEPVAAVRKQLSLALDEARAAAAEAAIALAADEVRAAEADARKSAAVDAEIELAGALERAAEALADACADASLTPAEVASAAALPDNALSRARDEVRALDDRIARCSAVLDERVHARAEHDAQRSEPATALDRARALLASAVEIWGAARAALLNDDAARARAAELLPAITLQQQRAHVWAALADVIGSADGARFRVFAQSLTLDALLLHANQQLTLLAPRYQLERMKDAGDRAAPRNDLDLVVVDRESGDEARAVASLSGGETFLVSLALALGLSSLSAQRTSVESLFIDEGFSTLDPDTLEQALAALEALRATGRQIGVISHVPALVERIGAQVRVVPLGGGRSKVEIAQAG